MGELIEPFARWLSETELSHAVTRYAWVWPAAETLHFFGMALLVGVIGLLDLRMLGVAKRLPIGPLHRLVPWGVLGFAINGITGFLFFTGDPFQYLYNEVFWWKMAFIAVAGLNIAAFYLFVFKKVEDLGPGEDAPMSAKLIAATSFALWVGVMYTGRMLPFIGGAF